MPVQLDLFRHQLITQCLREGDDANTVFLLARRCIVNSEVDSNDLRMDIWRASGA